MPFWDRVFRIEGMVRHGEDHPAEFPEEEIKIDEKMILKRSKAEPEFCSAHLLVEISEGEDPFSSRGNQLAEGLYSTTFACIRFLRIEKLSSKVLVQANFMSPRDWERP